MSFLSHDIEKVILKMYVHFSHSAVRRAEFFLLLIDGDFHEIKRHMGTRWLSLLPCIDTLLINYFPLPVHQGLGWRPISSLVVSYIARWG